MRKQKAFLVASLMILAIILSACQGDTGHKPLDLDYELGDTGGLELPITENNETIRILATTNASGLNDKYIIQKFREITGINIQIEAMPRTGSQEKFASMVAARNLPDIMGTVISDEMAMDLAVQGALASVEDYMDEMPNFRSIYVDDEENNWVFKSYLAADGKLYGVYGYDWNRDINSGMMYRKDIFDKHGLSMWNSPEEFYNVLKKLKELYPEASPYVSKTQKSIFPRWATSWGLATTTGKPYYDEEKKTWFFTNTDPKYKEMLDYMKKLYNEELLDPEFLTMTEAAWTAKMTKADQAFITNDWIGRMEQFVQIASETVPGYDLRYGNPAGPRQSVETLPRVAWAKYVAQSPNSGVAFKLLDFLLSPAGAELISMGIKGETYDIDEDGNVRYLDFPEGAKIETTDLEDKYGMYIEGMYMRYDRRSNYFNFTEREQEAQDFAKNSDKMEPIDPILPFNAEERTEIVDYITNLTKAAEEFSIKYVMTEDAGDAAWNEWVSQAENLGSIRLVEIYNDVQKRYDAM